MTSANPKIADYPFTTLSPGLGVVDMGTDIRFVLADIPGLIEGAAEGAGLGHRFLGHVERCRVLLHLIDCTQDDVAGAYKTIRHELAEYSEELVQRPEIVALNKIDALNDELVADQKRKLAKVYKGEILTVSGVARKGLREALGGIVRHLDRQDAAETAGEVDDGWSPAG